MVRSDRAAFTVKLNRWNGSVADVLVNGRTQARLPYLRTSCMFAA